MPIDGYESLCGEKQRVIVSKDRKHPQKHTATNVSNSIVTHWRRNIRCGTSAQEYG